MFLQENISLALKMPKKCTDNCNFCCFPNWKIQAYSIDLQGENQALPTKI